jgi:amino acid adenylation domain-containing protein
MNISDSIFMAEKVEEVATQRVLEELRDDLSIAAIFERRVAEHPAKIALQTPESEFTYQQVNGWANRVAHRLHREHSGGNGLVALWLDDTLAISASLMGIWKAGRTFVPGNFQAPDAYNQELFALVQPAVVLTSRALRAQVASFVPDETPILCWEDLAGELAEENLGLKISPEAVLRIVFTSGSTGGPKGVEHDQQGMMHEAYSAMAGAGYRVDDRFLQLSSLSHVNGSDWLFYVFMMGATLSCYPLQSWGVERLGNWVAEKRITRFVSVPTVFRHFVRLPHVSREQVRSVRVVHLGGEPVRPDDLRRFQSLFDPGAKLIANIGSTEGGSFARCIFETNTPVPEKLLPLGEAHPGIHLEIWNELEREVSPGTIGEIVVCSRGVARGYFAQPALTQSVFRPAPILSQRRRFKTGDLGWFDETGRLFSAGRRDRQVKIRGHRVELREIEDRLAEFPGISNVAVGAWSNGDAITQLVAYFSWERHAHATEKILRNWLRERLPHYMVPSHFRRVEKWPTLASGKIDREALAAQFRASLLPDGVEAETPTSAEAILRGIWERIFERTDIELTDCFFALGGDSLHATSLMVDIEVEMGKRLALNVIFESPTLRELAVRIEALPEVAGHLVRIGGGGGKATMLLVHGWGGSIAHYLDLAHSLRFDGLIVGLQGNEQFGRVDRPASIQQLAEYYTELILKEYPDQRYIVTGYSAGGVLAYVVAAALRAKGRPVELLITLDSRPNGVSLRRRGGMMWPYVQSRFSLHWQHLRALQLSAMWAYLTGRVQGSLNLAKSVARPVMSKQDYYIDLLCRHRLERCDIPTAVVQCQHTREQLIHGWQYLTGQRARGYQIQGNHEEILKGERVVELAALVERIVADHQIQPKRVE